MASRFSASDVRALSREQKLEALGIALRMKAAHTRWPEGGSLMTDQERLDEAMSTVYRCPECRSPLLRIDLTPLNLVIYGSRFSVSG